MTRPPGGSNAPPPTFEPFNFPPPPSQASAGAPFPGPAVGPGGAGQPPPFYNMPLPPVGGQWGGPLADEARGNAQNMRPIPQEDGDVDLYHAYLPPVPQKQQPMPPPQDPDDRARKALMTIENKLRSELSSLHEQTAEAVNKKLLYAGGIAVAVLLVVLLIYFIARR